MFKRIFSSDYRAARSAEAAGQLGEAAEHYALAGEHAEAARIHLARSERAPGRIERIAALRDALHWSADDPELDRRIRKNLGRTLLEQIRAEGVATTRDHGRVREAAEFLLQGDDYLHAGEAFESIDALQDAASAYKQGGLVERMEMTLSREDEHARRERTRREGFANYEMHMRIGERDAARDALRSCLDAADKKTEYRRLLDELESRLVTGGVVSLRKRQGQSVTAVATASLTLGRDSLCEFPLRAGGISRHHARISVTTSADVKRLPSGEPAAGGDADAVVAGPRFHLSDAGSRNGTFLAGMKVAGHVPLVGTGQFTLGEHCTIEFEVVGAPEHLLLRVTTGMDRGRTLIVGGDGESLDLSPLSDLAVSVNFQSGRPLLHRHADDVQLFLDRELIAHGAVQLIHGDELHIDGVDVEVL